MEHRAAATLLVLFIDGWQERGVEMAPLEDQREVGRLVLWEAVVSFSQAGVLMLFPLVLFTFVLLLPALYPVE